MKKMLFLAVLLSACGNSVSVLPAIHTGSPRVITDIDGGISVVSKVDFCGVQITWNYLDQVVTFKNNNERDVTLVYSGNTNSTRLVFPLDRVSGDKSTSGTRHHIVRGESAAVSLVGSGCGRRMFILGQ